MMRVHRNKILQGCKQQQTASGKKDFLNGASAYNSYDGSSHNESWCTDVM